MSPAEELKALPILLRHASGAILPNRMYVISEEAVRTLHQADVQFAVLCRESNVVGRRDSTRLQEYEVYSPLYATTGGNAPILRLCISCNAGDSQSRPGSE